MGQFTVYEDLRVDQTIVCDLRVIESVLRAKIPGLCSLVLVGGFGRGEGSVLFESGQPRPLNDYDIVVVAGTNADFDVLKELGARLASSLGVRFVDLIPVAKADLPHLPATQFNYDLKYGGYLFWGEDISSLMPDFSGRDVPEASGEEVLRNRMICLLECYTDGMRRRAPTAEESFFAITQCSKAMLACGEALLIKVGKYHHLCSRRADLLELEFAGMQRLARLHEAAVRFKLRPTEGLDSDPVEYWRASVREYAVVLALYLMDEQHGEARDSLADAAAAARSLYHHLRTTPRAPDRHRLVERVEICLIAALGADWWYRMILLHEARRSMRRLAGAGYRLWSWDRMRQQCVDEWFRITH
jgi:hypothetical protein